MRCLRAFMQKEILMYKFRLFVNIHEKKLITWCPLHYSHLNTKRVDQVAFGDVSIAKKSLPFLC